MSNKITVGSTTHQQGSKKKGLYGKKSSGKTLLNGGFSGEPTVTFTNISEEDWNRTFPNSYKPSWLNNK